MVFVTTFIVLGIAGIADAGYLVYERVREKPLVCPIGDNCEKVVQSAWGNLLGIHNDAIGVVYYAGLLLALAFHAPALWIQAATGAGLLGSLFLLYVQAVILKDYCFYCLLSALVNLLLFANSFAL